MFLASEPNCAGFNDDKLPVVLDIMQELADRCHASLADGYTSVSGNRKPVEASTALFQTLYRFVLQKKNTKADELLILDEKMLSFRREVCVTSFKLQTPTKIKPNLIASCDIRHSTANNSPCHGDQEIVVRRSVKLTPKSLNIPSA
jgi:hypothetical protein